MIVAAWRGSFTYRLWRLVVTAGGALVSGSLVVRVLSRAWRAFLVAVHGSRFVALPAGLSQPLHAQGESLSAQAVVRPYLWLRRTLGEGPVGRAARAIGVTPRTSLLARAGWAGLVGGGLLAAAAGRAAVALLDGSTPRTTALVSAGVLVFAAALFLVVFVVPGAVQGSLAARLGTAAGRGRSAAEPWWRRSTVFWVSLALMVVAGAAAGVAGGKAVLLVAAVAVVAAGGFLALFWPASLLVVLAAFPWVNWAARQALAATPFGGAVDDLLLLGSLAVLAVALTVMLRAELRRIPIVVPLLCAVVAAIGSVVVNAVPNTVAIYALRVTFQPVLFFFLGYLLPRSRRWTRWMVAALLVSSLLLALHGLFQYVTHAPMPKSWVDITETSIGTRAYSIIQNPNGLGAFLLLGSFVAGSLTLAPLGGRLRLAAGGVTVVLLACLAVTFSRGAWVGFAVGCFGFAALARPRMFLGLLIAAVVAPLVVPGKFLNRLTFAFSHAYLTKSLAAGRLYSWSLALTRIQEHPWFGVGLGTFGGSAAFLFKYTRIWVDNFYLQLAAEGGLILLFLFLWMLWRVAKALVANQRAVRDPFTKAIVAGAFGGFVAVCVANLTASVWETLVVGVGFWFLMGFATSPFLRESETAEEAPPAAAPIGGGL